MAISLQIYNLLSNLPKNYQKKRLWRTRIWPHAEVFYNFPQKSRKSQKGLRPAMRNVIKTHTDLTDHTDLFSVLPFIVRFFRYNYISAKSARSAWLKANTYICIYWGMQITQILQIFHLTQKARKSQKGHAAWLFSRGFRIDDNSSSNCFVSWNKGMYDWKKRESLLSKFLTRKHTYHQDIMFLCYYV